MSDDSISRGEFFEFKLEVTRQLGAIETEQARSEQKILGAVEKAQSGIDAQRKLVWVVLSAVIVAVLKGAGVV